MAKSTAFSLLNTLLVVGLLAAIALTVYNREAISKRLSSLRGQAVTVAEVPTPTPADASPTPTATPVPSPQPTTSPAPTPVAGGSIVDLAPEATPTPQPSGGSLPKSGPELNLAIATIPFAVTGSTAYYISLRRRLKKTWKDIEIR